MENRSHALAAGLFALILGTALVVALWWFSDGRTATQTYILESTGSVTGLSVEGSVRFRGIEAGQVTDIRIDPEDPSKVLVEIEIREDLPISEGTRARLGYQGVTGIAYVQLDDRGENRTPLVGQNGTPARLTLEPSIMDQLAERALEATERIQFVADRLVQFFDDENLARLKTTFERLESAAEGIDRTFADAPVALAALRAALSDDNVKRFSATLANFEEASDALPPTVAEARELMTRLESIAANVETSALAAGEGLMDTTLPQLNTLLRELTGTSRRLGTLIEELQASPQMLLVGRSRPPPGPGEDGFDPAQR